VSWSLPHRRFDAEYLSLPPQFRNCRCSSCVSCFPLSPAEDDAPPWIRLFYFFLGCGVARILILDDYRSPPFIHAIVHAALAAIWSGYSMGAAIFIGQQFAYWVLAPSSSLPLLLPSSPRGYRLPRLASYQGLCVLLCAYG